MGCFMSAPDRTDKPELQQTVPPVLVSVTSGPLAGCQARFSRTFLIGRGKDCDLHLPDNSVSRNHLRVVWDGTGWQLHDLDSANGSFVGGNRMTQLPLTGSLEVELGKGGPCVLLAVEQPIQPEQPKAVETETATREFSTETQIIQHYLGKSTGEPVGEQTMMFRRAFARVQKKKSRKYQVAIGSVLLLLVVAAGVITYQTSKLNKLRATAEAIFYTTKTIALQIAKLEEIVLQSADPQQVSELRAKRAKLKEMEQEYDNFVKELGVYQKLPANEQVILKVARIFGECDANVPKDFVKEVSSYIEKWRTTDRLQRALDRARRLGYDRLVVRILNEHNLPPQYVFLPLQESGFDERAVGPPTRFGHAKGAWQFITPTALRYGLRPGPLHDQGVYDPQDERFDFLKSTLAASKYIRDLNNTEAQASGLLVMASYNWGENNIRNIINQMPENPRDRNFWRLLAHKEIPRETYGYVFSIFSAAVICDNPHLFGFDIQCPVLTPAQGGAR